MTAIVQTGLSLQAGEEILIDKRLTPQETIDKPAPHDGKTWQKTGFVSARDSAVHIVTKASIEATGSVIELTATAFTMTAFGDTVGSFTKDHVSKACGKLVKKETQDAANDLYKQKPNFITEYVGMQVGRAAGFPIGKAIAKKASDLIPQHYAILIASVPALHIASKGEVSNAAILIAGEVSSRIAMNSVKGYVQSTVETTTSKIAGKTIGAITGAIAGEVTGMIAGKITKEGVHYLLASQDKPTNLMRDICKKIPMSVIEGIGSGALIVLDNIRKSSRENNPADNSESEDAEIKPSQSETDYITF